jgi:uncharacterized protein (TIGR02594 family)
MLFTPTDFTPYPWLEYAYLALGFNIRADSTPNQHNPYIVEFLKYTQVNPRSQIDETAWCSAFVNWCMYNAGFSYTGHALARSWLQWGTSLGSPMYGCVTILSREDGGGHVGFYVGPGQNNSDLTLLGGNQDDAICLKNYPLNRLLGYRWPLGLSFPS